MVMADNLFAGIANHFHRFMSTPLGTALLVVVYLTLNSTMNLLNRWALGIYDFHFPLLLTASHLTFGFLALAPFMLITKSQQQHDDAIRDNMWGLLFVGVFMATNISLNNASLVSMSLSLNQVIRAMIPCFTALFAVIIEKKTPSCLQTAGLIPISLGVIIAVFQGSTTDSSSTAGITFCAIATISNAMMMTLSGKVMTNKIDSIRLTFYTAPASVLVLLPFAMHLEAYQYSLYLASKPIPAIAIPLGTSVVALLYNIVHNQMIVVMSATTCTVIGNIKIVLLIFLSSFMFDDQKWDTKLAMGTIITMAGFFLYSYAGMLQKRRSDANSNSKAHHSDDDDEWRRLSLPKLLSYSKLVNYCPDEVKQAPSRAAGAV